MGLSSTRGRNYHRVVEFLGQGTVLAAIEAEAEPEPPPSNVDVGPFIRSCTPVSGCSDSNLADWLTRRSLPDTIPAGVSDGKSPGPYWVMRKAQGYRIIVPLFDTGGVLRSFQGVSWADSAKQWPTGISPKGLVFANKRARTLMGSSSPFTALLLVEGVIDYLTATARWGDVPVVGLVSGSEDAPARLALSEDAVVLIGTHLDAGAGLRLQDKVAAAIGHPVRRIPFEATA